jgi:hypothetical protein
VSRLWRDELRVGVCPDRLVVARQARGMPRRISREIVVSGPDPVAALKSIAGEASVTVILSNHFVRYAVLKGSRALKSQRDWDAYAQHALGSTYGGEAARWRILQCPTDVDDERIACAVGSELSDALCAMPQVRSVQPYLMAAFNSRRDVFASKSAWFVLQEPLRLAIALIQNGQWKLIRVRQTEKNWQSGLADILEREAEICGAASCNSAVLCSEEGPPMQVGRYEVLDASLPPRTAAHLRPHLMTLH